MGHVHNIESLRYCLSRISLLKPVKQLLSTYPREFQKYSPVRLGLWA